jgi:hypothetical protein
MRGCLRISLIVLGGLVVLAAVIALAFWLNWRRGAQLYEQAWDAYLTGNAEQALQAYQQYSKVNFGADEHQTQLVQSSIEELQDYLAAAQLQQEGRVDEATLAYQGFLEDHFSTGGYDNIYYFLAHQTLANLKPQQAQGYLDRGDFAAAMEVYRALLAQEPLVKDECPYEADPSGKPCQQAEAAIQQSKDAALHALPQLILSWSQSLPQGGNYLDFLRRCESLLIQYPEIARLPDGASLKAEVEHVRRELPAWFAQNPASPQLDYPTEVSRDATGQWVLTTRFRELAGMLAYTLHGSGWIIDAQGKKWGTYGLSEILRGKVTVPAGGEAQDTYRLEGEAFVNGYAVFTWEGEDEGGNPILLEERIHLLP